MDSQTRKRRQGRYIPDSLKKKVRELASLWNDGVPEYTYKQIADLTGISISRVYYIVNGRDAGPKVPRVYPENPRRAEAVEMLSTRDILGRRPTYTEVAKVLGISYQRVRQLVADAFPDGIGPLTLPKPPIDWDARERERFWSKVDKNGPTPEHLPELGPCWMWMNSKYKRGYGHFTGRHPDGKGYAHRYAWAYTHGSITPGMSIIHRCDNAACVNPAHLYEGTQADNVKDRERAYAEGRIARFPNGGKHAAPSIIDACNFLAANPGARVKDAAAKFGCTAGGISTRLCKERKKQKADPPTGTGPARATDDNDCIIAESSPDAVGEPRESED